MNRSSDFARVVLLASFLGLGCSSSDDGASAAPEETDGKSSTQAAGGASVAGEPGRDGEPGPAGATGPAGRDGHQRVFGDGSANALEITKDTIFDEKTPADGNLAFSSIHVAAGAQLTVPSGTVLRATGNVDIEGKLVVEGFAQTTLYGALGIPMPGRSPCEPSTYHVAGALSPEPHGGQGVGAVTTRYGLPSNGAMGGGSACGYGAAPKGGGRITIASGGAITVGASGSIAADGGESWYPQAQNMGGGGGGLVILGAATSITVRGSLSAHGGKPTKTLVPDQTIYFGGGGGGGGGILLFAPAIDTTQASLDVAGGIAPALPSLPSFMSQPYMTGGGGGGAVGDGGSGGFIDSYSDRLHAARNGEAGAVLMQKTHPANSPLF